MKLLLATLLAFGLAFNVQATEIILTSKNTVVMNKPFDGKSVAAVQSKLLELSTKSAQDLYLVLYSPGGSISAGKQLIAFAKALPNKVHTITQFAASMAYITAQHLDKRYILQSGTMMSHRASIGGLSGQIPGEASSRLSYLSTMVTEIFTSTALRVGMTYPDYLSLVYDELWLTGKKAVDTNHADEIVSVKCDDSLTGTYSQYIRTMFGSYNVKFSKCPLITGPVSIGTSSSIIHNLIMKRLDYSNRQVFSLTL
jgi:ATP-dependent Clp protease protease subunit